MAKTTAKVLGLALAGAGVYGLWTLGSNLLGDDEATGTQHVLNQVWIERLPEDPRDMIGHLVMLDLPEGRIGAAGRSSQWRHIIEVFQYGLEGHRLSIFFPQDRVKAKLKVRSWSCEGEAPKPFELCLEISDGRRKATFYSREDWHIDPDRVDESLAEIGETYPSVEESLSDVSIGVMVPAEELEGYAESEQTGPITLR